MKNINTTETVNIKNFNLEISLYTQHGPILSVLSVIWLPAQANIDSTQHQFLDWISTYHHFSHSVALCFLSNARLRIQKIHDVTQNYRESEHTEQNEYKFNDLLIQKVLQNLNKHSKKLYFGIVQICSIPVLPIMQKCVQIIKES